MAYRCIASNHPPVLPTFTEIVAISPSFFLLGGFNPISKNSKIKSNWCRIASFPEETHIFKTSYLSSCNGKHMYISQCTPWFPQGFTLPSAHWQLWSTPQHRKPETDTSWSWVDQIDKVIPGIPSLLEKTAVTSWWLNQPVWKILVKHWIIFPSRGENKTYLKPQPRT